MDKIMEHVLVANCNDYEGQYVATTDWNSSEVVSSSERPSEAYNMAIEMGVSDPVLIYVPKMEELNSL